MLLTTDKSIQLMYYFIVVCKVFNRQIFKWRTKSGIWYSLWFTLLLSGGFQCGVNGLTEFRGQVIEDVRTIKFSQSPFFVTGNVAVERGGELRIEPGVELRFLAGTGLLVRGTLVAEGRENRVITFTRHTDGLGPDFKVPTDVRLVDGPSIHEGRLQLFVKNKWWSVCTNSKNWTQTDFEVTCRQLGFSGGSFSKWYLRNNDSLQLSYERPNCPLGAMSLQTCDWNTRRLGSGVCDLHYDIGLHCEPQSPRPLNHWSGIRFESAKFQNFGGRRVSRSSIRHVEILYAGWNYTGNFTAALESYGIPPMIDRTTVRWSAYTGINITSPEVEFDISKCYISDNRGYGLFVNSSNGLVRLLGSTVSSNGADGIRYVYHDPIWPLFGDEAQDFCNSGNQEGSEIYPVILNAIQERTTSLNSKFCTRVFPNKYGYTLTARFVYLESSLTDGGEIELRAGSYDRSPLIAKFSISNVTRPQSVSVTSENMWIRFAPSAFSSAVVSMEIIQRRDKGYDLNISTTTIKENNGRGLAAENMRTMVHVVESNVISNKYLAGVHILGGAGDVNLTRTSVGDNFGDGVNVSYAGGRVNLTSCNLARNVGRGLAVWWNESSTVRPFDHYVVVAYSTVDGNGGIGVSFGNFCQPVVVNVTYTHFRKGLDVGLKVDTCWRHLTDSSVEAPLRLFVTHNKFMNHTKPSLVVSPAVNLKGIVMFNHFQGNSGGSLLIQNPSEIEELESLPAEVEVSENTFRNNKGSFVVAIGLSQYSLVQQLRFMGNDLKDNGVSEPFVGLTPRHRVAAVVTVSSSNVRIKRNLFENQDSSKYDIGSHLIDRYAAIDASLCYFGKYGDAEALKVYDRVFDSKDRYDLASIVISPYLLVPDKDETRMVSNNQSNQLVVDFRSTETPTKLGGVVYGRQELPEGTYTVWRDIYVRKNAELKLARKTTLKFAPSVGIMVQGKITVEGEKSDDAQKVLFTIDEAGFGSALPEASLRLMGGQASGDIIEGVLQVRIGERWGTVCSYGWNVRDSMLACASLGYVMNPSDWRPSWIEAAAVRNRSGSSEHSVILSNVRCVDYDVDIVNCKAERAEDFENSCTHDKDVILRCYRSTWAGIRLGLTAQSSTIRGARIERAGVLDPSLGAFKAALQIDANRHTLEDVAISNNLQSGVEVIFNDFYSDSASRRLRDCEVSGNWAHGVVSRTSGLALDACLVRSNRGHGIFYDPSLEHSKQRELSRWVDRSDGSEVVVLVPGLEANGGQPRNLNRGGSVYVVADGRTPTTGTVAIIEITTGEENVLGIQLLSQVHDGTNDTITVECGKPGDYGYRMLNVREEELHFPIMTTINRVLITYERHQRHGHGDAILYITAVERLPYYPLLGPVPTIRLIGSDFKQNVGAGFAAVHYDHQVGPLEQRRLRIYNESIEVYRCRLHDNRRAALLIQSPFHAMSEAPLANITYSVNLTDIRGNELGGIIQVSQDTFPANNVFHWLMADNNVIDNRRGGFEIALPRPGNHITDERNSVFIRNNTFTTNRNFAIIIGGHFARLEARFNRLMDNVCQRGLWSVEGTEKEILIEENLFERNRCKFILEVNADSHLEQFGIVSATFRRNRLQNNQYTFDDIHKSAAMLDYQPRSYTVGLRGLQKANITNNIFSDNALDYEFLAGIETGSLDCIINVRENWWGTTDAREIRRRIFDFDDWNSFAVADFSPFSQNPEIYSAQVHEIRNRSYVDFDNLGGRLFYDLILRKRPQPYVVHSDLTVMPGVTLYLEAGVELQFFPSVGILVLGTLRANGREDEPIYMRPFVKDNQRRWKRQALPSSQKGIRVCWEGVCGDQQQGFLELYNTSTQQWVPVCDPYFTEQNAQTVCREMGRDTINAIFLMDRRRDVDQNSLSHVVHWPEPRLCEGHEQRFEECVVRSSGFYGSTYPCSYDSRFVFVYCGEQNLPPGTSYWGGIRFSDSTFEPRSSYSDTNIVILKDSILNYVDIVGAGILHNRKHPAVFAVSKTPSLFTFVNVSFSASHGISLVAPTNSVNLNEIRVENNLGIGVIYSILYGESRSTGVSSFVPLTTVHLPPKVFGMADVCSSDKVMVVRNRILLYYKYDHRPADCVKIFRRQGKLGFRFLHLNLLNTTLLSPVPDSVRLYDGDMYGSISPAMIADITFESGDERRRFFQTRESALTVRLHASGGSEMLGFIAEVVSIPTASSSVRDRQHMFANGVCAKNIQGGLHYSNVGEVGPAVSVFHSLFKENGESLFGNFSTSSAAMYFDVQNTVKMYIMNNLVANNRGGIHIIADSETSAASLNAFITNNLLSENDKLEVLNVHGRKRTPVQVVDAVRNTITRNSSPYKDVIRFYQVMVNFTDNFVVNNTGDHVMLIVALDQTAQPYFQTIAYNSFWNNCALRQDNRSTIVLMGTGQRIVKNVFVNPCNDFEVLVHNLSSVFPVSDDVVRISAQNNWWGYNDTWAVMGRIWDGRDEPGLAVVVYEPYYKHNYTLLSGKCPPGWLQISQTCFIYIGGVMEYEQAYAYCQSINGSIPYVEDSNAYDIMAFIRQRQILYDGLDGIEVWVRTIGTPMHSCTAMKGTKVFTTRCNKRLPVVCETDPDVYLDPNDWSKYDVAYVAVGIVAGTILIVLIFIMFWLCKSRQRHLEKLERRSSIRSSIRSASSRSLGGSSTFGSSDLAYRRKMLSDEKLAVTKPVQLIEVKQPNGSVDSIAKSGGGASSRFGSSQLNSSVEDDRSYEVFEARNNQMEYSDYDEKFDTEAANQPRPEIDNDYFDDTRTTQTPSSSIGFGFDNKCYLETHFTSEETQSSSASSSVLDDPGEFKRVMEKGPHGAGSYESHSTPSMASQDYYRRHLLETEM